MKQRCIAVDLDGTLALWDVPWQENPFIIGAPVPAMVRRVKDWLAAGEKVVIFTARMDCYHPTVAVSAVQIRTVIQDWTEKHIGVRLPVTNRKTYWMKEIWDDRAIRIEQDTGRIIKAPVQRRRKNPEDLPDLFRRLMLFPRSDSGSG